jgi:hypothetical protein
MNQMMKPRDKKEKDKKEVKEKKEKKKKAGKNEAELRLRKHADEKATVQQKPTSNLKLRGSNGWRCLDFESASEFLRQTTDLVSSEESGPSGGENNNGNSYNVGGTGGSRSPQDGRKIAIRATILAGSGAELLLVQSGVMAGIKGKTLQVTITIVNSID